MEDLDNFLKMLEKSPMDSCHWHDSDGQVYIVKFWDDTDDYFQTAEFDDVTGQLIGIYCYPYKD